MLFRSTLTIFLLVIPSVLCERESKLLKSGDNRRRQLKSGKDGTVAPSVEDSCDGPGCGGPSILQKTFMLESDESSFSFGASEIPLPPGWTWDDMKRPDMMEEKPDIWMADENVLDEDYIQTNFEWYDENEDIGWVKGDKDLLEAVEEVDKHGGNLILMQLMDPNSGFEPGIVGTVFVNRGRIVSVDGEEVEDEFFYYTTVCTVLEGELDMEFPPGVFVAKASCNIDICEGFDEAWNPSCLYLRFSGVTNEFLAFVPTDDMLIRSRKLNVEKNPSFSFDFRASVISGSGDYRGSIGEASVVQTDNTVEINIGVLQFDFGDLLWTQ